MLKKPKLFVADYNSYADPFLSTFDLVDSIAKADVFMLTGGADILPSHYGEHRQAGTYCNGGRDKYELELYTLAQEKGIPTIGICRGAQLLCALAGGKLVQDVTGHVGTHAMHCVDGVKRDMSSLHHQMMRTEGTDHVLLGWTVGRSKHYHGDPDKENGYGQEVYPFRPGGAAADPYHIEPEVIYFKKNKGFGIQGHPEMMRPDHPTVLWCNQLVKEYILG